MKRVRISLYPASMQDLAQLSHKQSPYVATTAT
jgi:hypothetical protein